MTKQEAITALQEGKKVSHSLFCEGEWIELNKKDLQIQDEKGTQLNWSLFWKVRTADRWNTGWDIVK